MILRFLRLFPAYRILESEYARVCAENKTLQKRVKSLHRERDTMTAMAREFKGLMEHAESRVDELANHLDEARQSEIDTLRKVGDHQSFLRFGKRIFDRPGEVPEPIQEVERKPILKNRPQAADLVEQMRKKYREDVAEMERRQREAPSRPAQDVGAFFDEELKQAG